MQQIFLFLFGACSLCLFSCTPKYAGYASRYAFSHEASVPDYSSLNYWAAHPYKHNPSDSIPEPLVKTFIKDTTVDVFFIHPTTLTSMNDTSWNADVHNAALNAKTDYSTILYQASAFNGCRVFAPRYRQAHLRCYYTADTIAAKKAFDLAYEDIKAAFQYYLTHYNQGRPVIIASHSQGSTHAQHLLKEFFEHNALMSRLVVAYVIGMYIPQHYFTQLKPCQDATQTGCITGWRTYKKGYQPNFVVNEGNTCVVTNPLTWATNTTYAASGLNKGGVISHFNKVHPGINDAQVHNGIVWINRPHIAGSFLLRMKNFHVGDINLFYMNIRENMQQRIRAYKKDHGGNQPSG